MAHYEKTIDSRVIYEGRILSLRRDMVELENGSTAAREVVDHSGGVAVLALDENGNILFVSQFRYPFGAVLLELPAGKLEKGENPAECGMRELGEGMRLRRRPLPAAGEDVPHLRLRHRNHSYLLRDRAAPHPAAPRRGRVFDRPPHPGGKSGADGARRGNSRRENPARHFEILRAAAGRKALNAHKNFCFGKSFLVSGLLFLARMHTITAK